MFLYSVARELVPGNLATMALALELASTLSRKRDGELVIGPLSPSELTTAGLTVPSTAEHRDGDEDLEAWVGAVTSPGDLIVMPFHDASIGITANRIYRTQRSVLAAIHNPETSAASAVSPMNLPVGRTLGA